MAWIEKRVRTHHTAWRVGWRDRLGQRHFETYMTRDAAKARKAELEHLGPPAQEDGEGKATLAETFTYYMDTATDLRPTTRAKYETLGTLYVVDAPFADREIRSITRSELRRYVAELAEHKGAATVEAVARLLHRLFQIGVTDLGLKANPMSGISVAPARRREPRFLSESEVAAIVAEIPDRYRALGWTLAIAGLRIGEASALKVKNLDLKAGTIPIVENSPEVRGEKITGDTRPASHAPSTYPHRSARCCATTSTATGTGSTPTATSSRGT